MKILVTGGCGFIGSAVIRHMINDTPNVVINVDKLTYAGNLENLNSIHNSERYIFEQVDICNRQELDRVFATYEPDAICTWPLKAMLIAQLMVQQPLSKPISLVLTRC